MSAVEIIEMRIRLWEVKLAKAEGKYHSNSQNMDEKKRIGALNECRRCQAVLIELRSLREEIGDGGERYA